MGNGALVMYVGLYPSGVFGHSDGQGWQGMINHAHVVRTGGAVSPGASVNNTEPALQNSNATPTILIAGATGYVGGRLLKRLEKAGQRVRCLARRPESLRAQVAAETEVVAGDVLDPASLAAALQGIETAYYLVHSMGSSGDFEAEDREAAHNFATAARAAGVRKIIYLGGLGASDEQLSAHLRSRHEVGRILRESGVAVIEFRASIVIGSGSLSFEMIRSLTERLPIMIAPLWVGTQAQPIAVEDLLAYLVEALAWQTEQSRIFEIGGADQASYGAIMAGIRAAAGLAAAHYSGARPDPASFQSLAGADYAALCADRAQAG